MLLFTISLFNEMHLRRNFLDLTVSEVIEMLTIVQRGENCSQCRWRGLGVVVERTLMLISALYEVECGHIVYQEKQEKLSWQVHILHGVCAKPQTKLTLHLIYLPCLPDLQISKNDRHLYIYIIMNIHIEKYALIVPFLVTISLNSLLFFLPYLLNSVCSTSCSKAGQGNPV